MGRLQPLGFGVFTFLLEGNSVVLSVAVLGIVSAGVHHTGVIDFIFMREGLSEKRIKEN